MFWLGILCPCLLDRGRARIGSGAIKSTEVLVLEWGFTYQSLVDEVLEEKWLFA